MKEQQEYRSGHSDAVDHAYAGKYSVKDSPSEHYMAGYRQGLTQAHNLRLNIKEHELPHWAKK